MSRILKSYLKRLTNLSTRNKSLLLPGLPGEQFLDLNDTDFLLGKPSFDLLQQLLQRKSRISLCDVQDPRFERVNELSKKLRKIARTEAFVKEERGSQDLYVGYPFIRGKLSDGTPIHCPLLFFPVTLKIDKEEWCLFERDEVGITLNRSFALAYAHFNETFVADEVMEKSFEEFSKDFLEFRTQLYEWLKETPFRINFNQELFGNKLAAFDSKKGSELQLTERNGELKLYPEAVLGIFPQAGSYLVPDYNRLLEKEEQGNLQMLLLENDQSELIDRDNVVPDTGLKQQSLKEEEILNPFDTDESQERIIRAVKSGKSVVVQGPPGSGKSQLICNIMADFASAGKRVLLVCQKRVALDVVYDRLKTIGMNPFVALIHDFKNDRADLYRQFADQIEKVEFYKQQNYSLDAVFLERKFAQDSRLIDKTVSELDDFRHALFDDKECGVSIKELYLTCDPTAPVTHLKDLYRLFKIDHLSDYKRKLTIYSKYSLAINSSHPWYKRKSFSKFGLTDLRSIEKMLRDWPEVYQQQLEKFTKLTQQPLSTGLLNNLDEILERLQDILELLRDDGSYELFTKYIESRNGGSSHERLAFLRQITETFRGFTVEGGIEYSLDRSELSGFRTQLKKAIDSKHSAVGGIWWDIFGADKKNIVQIAANNELGTSVEHLLKLELKLRNRIEIEGWLQNSFLFFRPDYLDSSLDISEHYEKFFEQAELASDAAVRAEIRPWFEIIQHLVSDSAELGIFRRKANELTNWLKTWVRLNSIMEPFLTPAQINNLLENVPEYDTSLLSSLQTDFDSMVDMDQVWEELSPAEKSITELVLTKAKELGSLQILEIERLFENSIRLSWIEHIENKYPELRAVTSLKMQQWEEQLQNSIISKQKLSSDISGIKLRESTYENVENNRLGNRTTYRELNHQVTKKRKIWPIRKLIENYHEEVFALAPCWMASPEAVSAIFPMEAGLFDLVIFDEASQCYAEYGLPAAFRGKQLVITGDSKQLSPSDLYKVRYEDKPEEDEYSAALEIESLLDLAAQSLDQYQLSGHYRSMSLDLIEFSNKHFYKNTLRLLPDFNRINKEEPGIRYIKVDGIWKQNANLVEVDAVLTLLKELSKDEQSVGVVTFNFFQQQAIQEAVEREQMVIKDLFVKNIENVQGDERDVIIFSMGYAPDEKGKLSMHFGSLNAQGGQNRLNVAVTRARERIYFVTSLWPTQLNTELTANEGPKLLKEYMQYALNVSEGNYVPKPLPTDHFRTDWLLKNRLVESNENLAKDLPFGDLTLRDGKLYKGLVLTDDDLYHRSSSSKEPHAYLPLLLGKKHWPFRRVYSREFWTKSLKL